MYRDILARCAAKKSNLEQRQAPKSGVGVG
jgi:hypothetical protein